MMENRKVLNDEDFPRREPVANKDEIRALLKRLGMEKMILNDEERFEDVPPIEENAAVDICNSMFSAMGFKLKKVQRVTDDGEVIEIEAEDEDEG